MKCSFGIEFLRSLPVSDCLGYSASPTASSSFVHCWFPCTGQRNVHIPQPAHTHTKNLLHYYFNFSIFKHFKKHQQSNTHTTCACHTKKSDVDIDKHMMTADKESYKAKLKET